MGYKRKKKNGVGLSEPYFVTGNFAIHAPPLSAADGVRLSLTVIRFVWITKFIVTHALPN